MNSAARLVDLAASIGDGAVIDWERVESQTGQAERHLVRDLRLLERIASVHACLPPVAAFERSLHDSLLHETSTAGPEHSEVLDRWGPLTIVERIGSGTYTDVYRAHDPRLDRPVALKLLRHREAGSAVLESEAIEEARLLARVHHPNVVTVYGAERIDGRVGIWMELVEGQTLEQELRDRGPFSAEDLVAVGTALCGALGAVHGAGLLHRDVKAQNVMRDRDRRVLLTDFGTGHDVTQLRAKRELAGTPLYLAPEVLKGARASVASDVYSLGVLLYHLATASFPVSGRSLRDLSDAHARGAHVPLKDCRPDLPQRLAAAIDRAASPDLARRYASVSEFEATLITATDAPRSWRRERFAAVVVVLVLVCLPAWYFMRHRPSSAGVTSESFKLTQLTFNSVQLPATAAAISPDGQYLAYADANGLMVKTLSTNQQRLITLPEGPIDRLEWFQDSTSLLASTPGATWRITSLGAPPKRLSGGRISASPDGLHLAQKNAAGNSIRLLTVDGQDLGAIVPPSPQLSLGRAVWSPDGRRIAYWIKRLQPDGRWRPAIESCRLDGGGTTVIVSGGPFDSGGFAWSSDGRIFFSRPPPDGARRSDLWAVGVDARTGQPLGDPRSIWQLADVSFGQPSLTADGKSLVFLLNRLRTNVYVADFDLKRVKLSGLRQAVLADAENYPSSWAPLGDALLFQTVSNNWNGIYRQELDRGEPKIFLAPPKEEVLQAVVSPDAAWVFYLGKQGIGSRLFRVPAAGGAPELLFALPSSESWLRCSRASANVCVTGSLVGAQLELTGFDPRQGKPETHFALPHSGSERSWDLSPDGTEIVSLDVTGPSVRPMLLELGAQKVTALKPESWIRADFVAWSSDGKGWIVTRHSGSQNSEVLFINRSGQSVVLWKSTFQVLRMPMVSPDGHRIAFLSSMTENSVWMLQGF